MAKPQGKTPDWTALRSEFPTLARWTYLDVARKTIPPRCQERALQEYMRDVYENAGVAAWAATHVAKTRSVMARLLGAKSAGLKTATPEPWEERAQIVNVLVPDAAALMERLRENHRVVTNVKDDALRLSMSFFNNEEDLDRAIHAIKRELSGRAATAA